MDTTRRSVHVPVSLWEKLEQRATTWGVTQSEAIRRAIWLLTYEADRLDQGAELVLHYPDGKQERLVISPY